MLSKLFPQTWQIKLVGFKSHRSKSQARRRKKESGTSKKRREAVLEKV
jgi:hypothetical protein